MNLLRTFESRVSDAFGGAPQGYTAPFSFRKLAKKAARELEAETYEIDGIDTAPALYTILVSSADDVAMRPLYAQLTQEITAFVEAQAQSRSYVFVGKPLARFMVDPSLRSGKFAVFAENVDASTLARLRAEEDAFLSGSMGLGGAAKAMAQDVVEAPRPVAAAAQEQPRSIPEPEGSAKDEGAAAGSGDVVPTPKGRVSVARHGTRRSDVAAIRDETAAGEFAPLVGNISSDASAGLNVIPDSVLDGVMASPAAAMDVPATQRRNVPLVNPQRAQAQAQVAVEADAPGCLLIDHQSGRTYNAKAPSTIVGRERTPGGIVLRDPNVSRRHAELSYDGGSWHLRDLGSTNGTLVNDTDVDSCILHDGDLITVGLMNLEFREG